MFTSRTSPLSGSSAPRKFVYLERHHHLPHTRALPYLFVLLLRSAAIKKTSRTCFALRSPHPYFRTTWDVGIRRPETVDLRMAHIPVLTSPLTMDRMDSTWACIFQASRSVRLLLSHLISWQMLISLYRQPLRRLVRSLGSWETEQRLSCYETHSTHSPQSRLKGRQEASWRTTKSEKAWRCPNDWRAAITRHWQNPKSSLRAMAPVAYLVEPYAYLAEPYACLIDHYDSASTACAYPFNGAPASVLELRRARFDEWHAGSCT